MNTYKFLYENNDNQYPHSTIQPHHTLFWRMMKYDTAVCITLTKILQKSNRKYGTSRIFLHPTHTTKYKSLSLFSFRISPILHNNMIIHTYVCLSYKKSNEKNGHSPKTYNLSY